MINTLTLTQMALEYGGTVMHPDCYFDSVSTDSRDLIDGQLFVALKGEKFDGHKFSSLVAAKVSGLVIERPMRSLVVSQWVVSDTTKALGQIARENRKSFNGHLIAITGSCGKTSIKNMVATILEGMGKVLSTKGNFNNEIGVPYTLMKICSDHDYAVVEMGARAAGDIGYLCNLALPDVALVSNVLPAHLEGFGSLTNIAKAKGEIYRSLPTEGIAVINLDEDYAEVWSESTNARVLNFSMSNPKADFTAKNLILKDDGCYSFTLVAPNGEVRIALPVSGKHNILNAIAAAACSYAAGAQLSSIADGLNNLIQIPNRMNFKKLPSGVTLIDDSYNANPGSVKAAINNLAVIKGLHVLVLGDMAELGEDEVTLHAEIGAYALDNGIDILLAVGPLCFYAVREFGSKGCHFSDKKELISYLNNINFLDLCKLNSNTVVLVKGSRFMAMEDIAGLIETLGGV